MSNIPPAISNNGGVCLDLFCPLHTQHQICIDGYAFVFLVPYFDLDVIRFGTPPCPLQSAHTHTPKQEEGRTHQIKSTADKVIPNAGTVLGTPAADKDNRVLLNIMSCDTHQSPSLPFLNQSCPVFSVFLVWSSLTSSREGKGSKSTLARNIGSDNPIRAELDSGNFALG